MDKQRDIIQELAQYKGVVFDLDGTLVDLGVDWVSLKQELSLYCKKEKGIEMEFTPLDQKIHEAKKKFGDHFFLGLLEKISYFELREEKYRLNNELVDFVNSASNQRIAIYSMNTEKCVENFIDRYLTRKPDRVITKDTCLEPKPTDKDLKKILKEWDMTEQEVVYIGNSENDRLSGEKAGIKTVIIQI